MTSDGNEFGFELPNVGGEPLDLPPRRVRRTEGNEATSAELTGRTLAEGQANGLLTTIINTDDGDDAELVKARSCPMPNRIWRALTDRANRENTTAKHFILKGLQMQGFPIRDEDLEDRRGSFIKEAARQRREQKISGD